jgi:hypothetical protein
MEILINVWMGLIKRGYGYKSGFNIEQQQDFRSSTTQTICEQRESNS